MQYRKTGNKKYPLEITYPSGRKVLLPDQKQFGSDFCKKHGCSMAAISFMAICTDALQSDGSYLNPAEMYDRCRKHVSGFKKDKKLTIYGCCTALNWLFKVKKMTNASAQWFPNTGKNNAWICEHIKGELAQGNIVLFEEAKPVIHTVVLFDLDEAGLHVLTNGSHKVRTLSGEVSRGLHSKYTTWKGQTNWWSGSQHGAGYVVVRGVLH